MAGVTNQSSTPTILSRLGGYRHLAGPAIGLVIFAVGIAVLHHLAAEISWTDVKQDIASLSLSVLALSLAFTAISYFAFSLYDVLALRAVVPGKVPSRVAVMAGASGYAISNLIGFSYVTGPAIRTRVYSVYGVDLAVIASVIASIWLFFWLGIAFLVGMILLLHPTGIVALQTLSPTLQRVIAIVLLGVVFGFLFWLARGRRTLNVRSFSIPLPGLRLAASQISVGMIDVLAAALALYVLMPDDVVTSFPLFFVVFVGAVGLGLASHAPGGLGVFEATIIAGLGAAGRADVLAALLSYRLIYYLIPFLLASLGLGVAWSATKRQRVTATGKQVHAVIGTMIPALAAGLALLTGIVLLLSGNLPGDDGRLQFLEAILPLSLVEVSHLMASMAGVLLIVLANGLYRKQYKAWLLAMGLVAAGVVLSLLKGFDWEEALVLAFVMSVLFLFRSAFYRSANQPILVLSPRWGLVSIGVVAITIWVGLFAYSHVEYSDDLWWRFAWDGDAPRYLRASLAAGIVLAAVGLNTIINASGRRLPAEPIPDPVRAIVAASTNAEANIHLTGDKRFLVSHNEDAFIGYADTGHSLIAKGDPIGDHRAGQDLIWQLRQMADRMGKHCAYYAVWEEFLPAYLDMGCSILKIGEVARVHLPDFTLDGSGRKGFRHAMSKAERDGYVFEIIKREEIEPVLPQLRAISDAWLGIKHGEEKRFALGRFDEAYMRNFDHAVLRYKETGQILAFANLFQTAQKHELSLDLMRYDPSGPGFMMNALFADLLIWGKEQGFKWFSLGAAPFAGMEAHPMATAWNRFGNYVYRHGEQFYHFEGLRAFKQKFDPVWSPNYLAVPRGSSAPRILYEVNGLISGGVKGLMK